MICFYMVIVNGKKVFGGKAWSYEDCLRYCERNEIPVDCIECIGR